MSGSAGVMSNQVAKPAKPAPDLATASIALAGTILARMVPKRSRKEMRKYLIRFFLAVSHNDGIARPLFEMLLPESQVTFFPVPEPNWCPREEPAPSRPT